MYHALWFCCPFFIASISVYTYWIIDHRANSSTWPAWAQENVIFPNLLKQSFQIAFNLVGEVLCGIDFVLEIQTRILILVREIVRRKEHWSIKLANKRQAHDVFSNEILYFEVWTSQRNHNHWNNWDMAYIQHWRSRSVDQKYSTLVPIPQACSRF